MNTKIFVVSIFLLLPLISVAAEPPYFDTTGALNSLDNTGPTTFTLAQYEGQGERSGPYGFSFEEGVTVEAYLFRADYSDGPSMEFQIHPEFGSVEASSTVVEFFAPIIGRLPYALRRGLKRVWVVNDEGNKYLGGGGMIALHYLGGLILMERGQLEEILAHEASHASLDDLYKHSDRWLEAEGADNQYISVNARDNDAEEPTQNFLAWMALRYRPDNITAQDREIIAETIPHRLAFYDSLNLNMEPLAEFKFLINAGLNDAWFNPETNGQGFFVTVFPEIKQIFLSWFTFETERPVTGTAFLGESGHRWLTAYGPYENDTAELTIELTHGGVFDKANPQAITEDGYGTMTLEFVDCREGIITYDIPSLGLAGQIPIRRIAEDNVQLCEALNEPLVSGMAFIK